MLIFLYLTVLMASLYCVVKILGPEMSKPQLKKKVSDPDYVEYDQSDESVSRVERLETLLVEKNKNISSLQTELQIFYAQIRDFDKVKSVFEEEIQRLREQNRIFRSELGLPAAHPKENALT